MSRGDTIDLIYSWMLFNSSYSPWLVTWGLSLAFFDTLLLLNPHLHHLDLQPRSLLSLFIYLPTNLPKLKQNHPVERGHVLARRTNMLHHPSLQSTMTLHLILILIQNFRKILVSCLVLTCLACFGYLFLMHFRFHWMYFGIYHFGYFLCQNGVMKLYHQ